MDIEAMAWENEVNMSDFVRERYEEQFPGFGYRLSRLEEQAHDDPIGVPGDAFILGGRAALTNVRTALVEEFGDESEVLERLQKVFDGVGERG